VATPSDQSTRAIVIRRITSAAERGNWEEFDRRYGILIRKYCLRMGLPPDEYDELLQEVFLGLLQRLPRFRYVRGKGGFRAYLWRVVRNQTLALKRRRQRSPLPLHAESLASPQRPDQVWEKEWARYQVRSALEQVGKETSSVQMRVFSLYVLERLPVDEVASRCGCSKAMVYKIKSLLLARLRRIVSRRIALES